MATDPNVTKLPARGTNAAGWVMAVLRGRYGQLALWAVLALARALVSSASQASDLTRRGIAFQPVEPWVWELSSAFALLLWLLPVLRVDEALRARVRGWPARLVVYALASAVFCVLHVGTMVALRCAAYALAGGHYDFGPPIDGFVYEYRKDALTFALVLGVAAVWRSLSAVPGYDIAPAVPDATAMPAGDAARVGPAELRPAAPAAPTFLVRTKQGDLLIRADEIDWIEAQGNYVALHLGADLRLMRHTLAEMETRLAAYGFIRTHRRAIVNRARMQAIIPPELGELGVRLTSGQIAPLSEGRRSEVLRLVLGAPA